MATTGEPRQGFLARLPRVGKCCDCIALRTGTIIIAVLSAVGCLLYFAFCIVFLQVVLPKLKEQKQKIPDEITETQIYVEIAATLVCLGFSILLLIGAINRKPVLLKIYIFLGLIGAAFVIITIVMTFFADATVQQILFYVLKLVGTLIIEIYFLLCINSYLQQMLEEQQAVVPESERFKPI